MRYTRLYAGPDGESHFEDVEQPLEAASMADWRTAAIPVQNGAFFLASHAGHVVDWHTAPQRQLLLTLSGACEYRASDGAVRQLGPGSALLVEDTTGKGHQTRIVQDRLVVFLPLADGWLAGRAAGLAARFRQEGAALIEAVERVSEDDWSRVPQDAVWSPGKDADHVWEAADYHQRIVRSALTGEPLVRGSATVREVMITERPKAEVLELLRQRLENSANLVASLSDQQLDLPAPPRQVDGPPRSLQQAIEEQMIHHYVEHRQNIESKLAASA